MFSRCLRLGAGVAIFNLLAGAAPVLKVCADPNNLPFSSRNQPGLENRLAELLASDLGTKVEYVWWAESKNFIRKTLNAGVCDVLMGVPATLDSVAVTRPYYRSTYVWISRMDRAPVISSLFDDRLAGLRIGVHLVDDSYVPPAQLLAHNGLVTNLVSFSLHGPAGDLNPPARLIEAVQRGDVDLGLAWGPLAGYFAGPALQITPVTPRGFGLVPFVYEIAVAVRQEDKQLRDTLDGSIARQCAAIQALLQEYKVPLVEEGGPLCAPVRSASVSH